VPRLELDVDDGPDDLNNLANLLCWCRHRVFLVPLP
jgi:hypothetical protein